MAPNIFDPRLAGRIAPPPGRRPPWATGGPGETIGRGPSGPSQTGSVATGSGAVSQFPGLTPRLQTLQSGPRPMAAGATSAVAGPRAGLGFQRLGMGGGPPPPSGTLTTSTAQIAGGDKGAVGQGITGGGPALPRDWPPWLGQADWGPADYIEETPPAFRPPQRPPALPTGPYAPASSEVGGGPPPGSAWMQGRQPRNPRAFGGMAPPGMQRAWV